MIYSPLCHIDIFLGKICNAWLYYLLNCTFQAPIVLDNVETKKLVLVHGEGFGAWCWYKTITMLEEAGLEPIALDLTGSGIDTTDTNIITSLEDYAKPLINYLHNLPEGEKVKIFN